jgi:Ras-related protein Rab-18
MAAPTFKILLVGDSGVGKSSLMLRFAADTFNENISATIGIDFKVKAISLDDGSPANLQIWDTAGQERFRTLTSSYYRGAHAVIMVYDCTDVSTFESLTTHWMEEVRTYCNPNEVTFLLVGNKCDLFTGAPSHVPPAKAEAFARDHQMMFVKCSARTKEGVVQAFEEVGRCAADRLRKKAAATAQKETINLNQTKTHEGGEQAGICC